MALCATACEDRRAYLLGIAETVVWCVQLKLFTRHFTPPGSPRRPSPGTHTHARSPLRYP